MNPLAKLALPTVVVAGLFSSAMAFATAPLNGMPAPAAPKLSAAGKMEVRDFAKDHDIHDYRIQVTKFGVVDILTKSTFNGTPMRTKSTWTTAASGDVTSTGRVTNLGMLMKDIALR
jgi:hypothetical protein